MAGKFPSPASPEAAPRLTFVCPSRANNWRDARLSCPKHLAARHRFHGPMPVAPLSDITVELQLPPRRRESLTATRFTPWCNGNTAPTASGLFLVRIIALYRKTAKATARVPRGVTVTQRPLEALFLVQIQAG